MIQWRKMHDLCLKEEAGWLESLLNRYGQSLEKDELGSLKPALKFLVKPLSFLPPGCWGPAEVCGLHSSPLSDLQGDSSPACWGAVWPCILRSWAKVNVVPGRGFRPLGVWRYTERLYWMLDRGWRWFLEPLWPVVSLQTGSSCCLGQLISDYRWGHMAATGILKSCGFCVE